MYQLLESLQIYLSSLGFQCGMDLALAVQVKSWLTGLVLAEERRIVVPFLVLDLYTTYILLIYYLYTTYILLIYYLYTTYILLIYYILALFQSFMFIHPSFGRPGPSGIYVSESSGSGPPPTGFCQLVSPLHLWPELYHL